MNRSGSNSIESKAWSTKIAIKCNSIETRKQFYPDEIALEAYGLCRQGRYGDIQETRDE